MTVPPIDLYHGSDRADLTIDTVSPGLHAGSRAQAEMRWPKKHLYRIRLKPTRKVTRLKDTGSWNRRQITNAARRAPLAVYLNRFEGLSVDVADMAARYDNAADSVFRKNVAGCEDSWIILDPSIILEIELLQPGG